MTGLNKSLNVYLGTRVIANLRLENEQLIFQYTAAWQQSGYALSPYLPLTGDIPSINIQRYLRNLFPEGDLFDLILGNFHLSKQNTFGIIQALGADTSGSLLFLSRDQPLLTTSTFQEITADEIERRLAQHKESSLIIWDKKPRLSMAGVQDKINIMVNLEGKMGFGEGTLCSTHLLKFEKQSLSHLVLNEYVTMQLAQRCGIQVADTQLLRFGKYPALLIKRFDRKLTSDTEVLRKQVIDGCQAMNLPPEYKYERNFGSGRDVAHIREGASFSKLLMLANQCINPAITKSKMIDWMLFNLLVNNYDAHGKNISFFVNEHGMSLTPFYDLVNVGLYPQFDGELAMAVGDDFDSETIGAYQLADFADSHHLSRNFLVKQLKNLSTILYTALSEIPFTRLVQESAEIEFLLHYEKIVKQRCRYFQEQAEAVLSVSL